MRTSVHTNPADPDETDEYPGCASSIDQESGGELTILDEGNGVEQIYAAGEWISVETVAD